MNLKISTDSGLLKSFFCFGFTKEEFGPNNDGFYSSYILFYTAFNQKELPIHIFGQNYFTKSAITNCFTITSMSFAKRNEQEVFESLIKICDFVLAISLEKSRYADGVDKDRVISGYSTAKAFASKIKDDIKNNRIKIEYEYTDPWK